MKSPHFSDSNIHFMNWNYHLDSIGIMRLTWRLCTWSPILLV